MDSTETSEVLKLNIFCKFYISINYSTETSEVLKHSTTKQLQQTKLKFNRNIWSIETLIFLSSNFHQLHSTETSEVLKHAIAVNLFAFFSYSTETSEVLKQTLQCRRLSGQLRFNRNIWSIETCLLYFCLRRLWVFNRNIWSIETFNRHNNKCWKMGFNRNIWSIETYSFPLHFAYRLNIQPKHLKYWNNKTFKEGKWNKSKFNRNIWSIETSFLLLQYQKWAFIQPKHLKYWNLANNWT